MHLFHFRLKHVNVPLKRPKTYCKFALFYFTVFARPRSAGHLAGTTLNQLLFVSPLFSAVFPVGDETQRLRGRRHTLCFRFCRQDHRENSNTHRPERARGNNADKSSVYKERINLRTWTFVKIQDARSRIDFLTRENT